jgi:hypothetical protein
MGLLVAFAVVVGVVLFAVFLLKYGCDFNGMGD